MQNAAAAAKETAAAAEQAAEQAAAASAATENVSKIIKSFGTTTLATTKLQITKL